MSFDVPRPLASALSGMSGRGNVGMAERWVSATVGLSLTLRALRGSSVFGRALLAGAGLSMLARGVTGYCAVKGALTGQMSLQDGMKEQFRQLRHAVSSETVAGIDDMQSLYNIELQELHSAEIQLSTLIERVVPSLQAEALKLRLEEYVTELQSRKVDLESLLARSETDARSHPDDAIRALLGETQKMARVCAPTLRDAAITASLQRILHYKIAGYGTIAAYAKALGRIEEAAHFAELADRDKAVDADLTQLAKDTINPEASVTTTETQMPGSLRTH